MTLAGYPFANAISKGKPNKQSNEESDCDFKHTRLPDFGSGKAFRGQGRARAVVSPLRCDLKLQRGAVTNGSVRPGRLGVTIADRGASIMLARIGGASPA